MTLNQIISRIRTLALAHKQIRRFSTGLAADLFNDRKAKYPACCLQYTTGSISTSSHVMAVTFKLILIDLVHVSEDTKTNQDDVLSDMFSVLSDLVAEMNAPQYGDWLLSADNVIEPLIETEGDMAAGWAIDFAIQAPFTQNICQIPTDAFDFPDEGTGGNVFPGTDLKSTDVIKYIADGSEGSTLVIPQIVGKKIILVIRGGNPIYPVNINPDSDEYTWDYAQMVLGVPAEFNQKFIIIYRNL